jgi:hypothetical protein
MATVQCKACERVVSSHVINCPHCGVPVGYVVRPNSRGTPESALAGFLGYLESQGYGPKAEWFEPKFYDRYPRGDGVANDTSKFLGGKIQLDQGPISRIELVSETVATEFVEVDGPGGNWDPPEKKPARWNSKNSIVLVIVPEWGQRWIPGLHHLFLRREAQGIPKWWGNDVGLGIMDDRQ